MLAVKQSNGVSAEGGSSIAGECNELSGKNSATPLPATTWRFGLTFIMTALLLLGIYYFPYPRGGTMHGALLAYLRAYARAAGILLRLFEPGVLVRGQDIVGRYSIRIVKTCDGMDVNILLLSAIMAWPSSLRMRLAGATVGIAVLSVANVTRICSLYLVGVHAPDSFEFMHVELLPALMLSVAVVCFLLFIRHVQCRQ